jgi:hypothetical protein
VALRSLHANVPADIGVGPSHLWDPNTNGISVMMPWSLVRALKAMPHAPTIPFWSPGGHDWNMLCSCRMPEEGAPEQTHTSLQQGAAHWQTSTGIARTCNTLRGHGQAAPAQHITQNEERERELHQPSHGHAFIKDHVTARNHGTERLLRHSAAWAKPARQPRSCHKPEHTRLLTASSRVFQLFEMGRLIATHVSRGCSASASYPLHSARRHYGQLVLPKMESMLNTALYTS